MSIAKLLHTTDLRVLTRSLKLYNSYFISNTDEVFENFNDYLPFYMFVLRNRDSLPIAYFDLSERLIQAVSNYGANINPKAIKPILLYFYHTFCASNTGFKIDSFVEHMFEPSHSIPIIVNMFSEISPCDHLEILLRILAESKSLKILKIIEGYKDECVNIICENSELVDICLRCLLSLVKDIISFIACILNSVVTKKPQFIEHLLPYCSYIQAKIDKSNDLKTLNHSLMTYLNQQKLPPPPLENMSAPLSRVLLNSDAFGKQVNVQEFINVLKAKRQVSSNSNPLAAMSLSKRLDELTVAPISSIDDGNASSDQTKQQEIIQQQQPKQVEQVNEFLEVSAYKLGGFQKNTWQSRFFQFYPNNHCLVWRAKKGSPEIKGLLLLDSTITIEKNPKNIKNRQNVIQIKLAKKVHEISFNTTEDLDKWYNAFKSSIESKQS